MLRTRTYPLENVTQAASAEELRAWLAYPEFTAEEISVANALVAEATDLLIDFMQREIKPRKRRLEVPEWPSRGTRAGNLRDRYPELNETLHLPYGPVISIQQVTVDGTVQDSSDYELKGDELDMTPADDVVVDYTAGYDDASFFEPAQIKRAVLALSAWLWHHRGDEGGMALKESGAAGIVRSLIRYAA